jgi:hypothetical protein
MGRRGKKYQVSQNGFKERKSAYGPDLQMFIVRIQV